MNVYLYGCGPEQRRQWLMVDLGLTFPEGEFDPGVDVILPDLRFIEEERQNLLGIVLTHAHEDHFGAVLDLWPRLKVPVYATPFTVGLLKAKMAENGVRLPIPIHKLPIGGRVTLGPFEIELVTMAHSIPEPNALAIRTPHGMVLHTGDWKIDATPVTGPPTDSARLDALGRAGIDVLVCDSTNAMREGISPSEREVASTLAKLVREAPRRVAITTFASNVGRVLAVAEAARAAGRRLVIAGRAMHRIIEVAKETGYLPRSLEVLDQREFEYQAAHEVVALCTGSQGESRAAMARIAEGTHPDIALGKDDLVIFSSRTIPGNEKSVGRIQNLLTRRGCRVLTDTDGLVHVTGHPRREELKRMYAWCRPRVAIPMHGEARHLAAHAELARAAGVPHVEVVYNGEMIRLAPGTPERIDEAPSGRLFRDGRLIVPSGEGPVRERRRLALVGIVVVSLVLSRQGEVLAEPEVAFDGVPNELADGEMLEDRVLDVVEGTLKGIKRERRRDAGLVTEAVRRAARAAVAEVWGKKPICKVLLTRI
ncbi:MAG: ribonuclease J [Hyphomicrobiaceae bacterium]